MTTNDSGDTPAWRPPTPEADPRRSINGLAVTALVLSIVWLCGLGSALAVIFGHISLRQIKRDGERGRGFAITGLVVGYVGIVSVIATAGLLFAASSDTPKHDSTPWVDGNGVRTTSGDHANPPQKDVTIARCRAGDDGHPLAELDVTNHASERSDYDIDVQFVSTDTPPVLIESAQANTRGVAPGDPDLATAEGEKLVKRQAFRCLLSEVDRFRASGSTDANGVFTDSDNHTHPPQNDATIVSCKPDGKGAIKTVVSLTNHSSDISDYTLSVVVDQGGNKSAASIESPLLPLNQTTTAAGSVDAYAWVTTAPVCRLAKVDRSSSVTFGRVDAAGVVVVEFPIADGTNAAATHPARNDVELSGCQRVGPDSFQVIATVTNHTSATNNYDVAVGFNGPRDRLAATYVHPGAISSGATRVVTVVGAAATSSEVPVSCRLLAVTRIVPADALFPTTTPTRSG